MSTRDMKIIATIGYEGAQPSSFDAALNDAQIQMVVDVRAIAMSRRRGFSKTALSDRLEKQGVRYLHLRGLGDPKPGREAARAGNMPLFRKIFAAHLATEMAQIDLEALRMLASARRVALLCYEADADTCHRTIVANAIAKQEKLSIVHLRVERGQAAVDERSRAGDHPRQSLAAA